MLDYCLTLKLAGNTEDRKLRFSDILLKDDPMK